MASAARCWRVQAKAWVTAWRRSMLARVEDLEGCCRLRRWHNLDVVVGLRRRKGVSGCVRRRHCTSYVVHGVDFLLAADDEPWMTLEYRLSTRDGVR
jgi:hypothetical protein